VIELASFRPIADHEMDFLKRLSETIGAALANLKSREKTLQLLKEAQELSQQLEQQQKELLEKNKILEAKQTALLRVQAELEGQVNALNNAGLVIELHPSGKMLSGNNAFYRHFSSLSLEDQSIHFDTLLTQSASNPSFGRIQPILETEGVWKGELQLKNEETYFWFDTSITAIRDEENKIQRYIAVLIDITRQKVQEEQLREALEKMMTQEEELRQNAEELQAMLEELKRTQIELKGQINAVNNAAIVSEADPQGRIIFVNEAFVSISKYSREELIGQNHRILKSGHQPDTLFEDMWKTIASGEVWKGEVKNKAKDGTYYWITLTITPVMDRNGRIVKYIGVAFDITEQKTQAEQLQAALEISQAQEAELRQITAELQAAHEEMRKTQIELRGQIGALNNAAIVVETDLRGVITMVNDAFCKLSGYKREELLGKNHRILNSGYHSEAFFQEMWNTIQAGKVWSGIFRNRAKDGSYFWVKTTITPVLGFDGKPVKYISVSFDITPQVEQEEKIRRYASELERNQIELEGRIRALNNAGMVTETDPNGIITYVSDETLAIWGYERDEVIGNPHSIVKSDEHPPQFFQKMWEVIQSGEVWHGEVKNRAKDGSEFWVFLSITPVLDKEKKVLKYIGVAFDITAQKRQGQRIKEMLKEAQEQEKQLREYAKKLEEMQEKLLETQMELAAQISALNNAAIVSETDPQGIITFVNEEATYIWGYTKEEVIGKPHSIIKSDYHKESFFKRMWEKISQGLVWQGQVKNRAKDGSHFWVHLTITPVLDDNGKPKKYIGVAFDITAQKEQSIRIREALEEAERQEKQYKAEIERLTKQLLEKSSGGVTIANSVTLYLNEEGRILQCDGKHSFFKEGELLYSLLESKEDANQIRMTLAQSQPWKGSVMLRLDEQTRQLWYLHLIPIMGENQVLEGIMAMAFELTENLELTEQLQMWREENQRLRQQLSEIQKELESLTLGLDL
jgi:PAS domain S-box-containing protein